MEQRDFELVQQLYVTKWGMTSPWDELAIGFIESELDVKLPVDFREISKFFAGGILGGFVVHQISSKADNAIVADTRMLRDFGNPHNCIVLANDECGMLYLKTDDSVPSVYHTGSMPLPDAIVNEEVFQTWTSYGEFFCQMINSD